MPKVTKTAAQLAQVAEILSQWSDGLITEREAWFRIFEVVSKWPISDDRSNC